MNNEVTLKAEVALEPESKQLLGEAIRLGPPPWRARVVQILQIVGVLIGFLGTAEAMNMIQALSPEIGAWLALSGAALRFGIEPLVLLIGDIVDDGKINKSFKLQDVAMFLMIAFVLPSCVPPGLEIVTHSQYGSASYKDGILTATPTVPLTFPIQYAK